MFVRIKHKFIFYHRAYRSGQAYRLAEYQTDGNQWPLQSSFNNRAKERLLGLRQRLSLLLRCTCSTETNRLSKRLTLLTSNCCTCNTKTHRLNHRLTLLLRCSCNTKYRILSQRLTFLFHCTCNTKYNRLSQRLTLLLRCTCQTETQSLSQHRTLLLSCTYNTEDPYITSATNFTTQLYI